MEAFYGFIGQIFATLAFLILGPAPFIPYERTLWMIYLAQIFTGLATSAMFACAYSHALRVAKWRGYSDNIQTNGFVSISVQASMVIGGLITPPLAGYVVQEIGYRNGTAIMFVLYAAWIPVTFALWMHSLFSLGSSGEF
ncbi:MFS-type transporter SLC18B1-like [Ixodes scapularis]